MYIMSFYWHILLRFMYMRWFPPLNMTIIVYLYVNMNEVKHVLSFWLQLTIR